MSLKSEKSSEPRRGPSTHLDDKASGGGRLSFAHKASLRENKGADIANRYRIDAKEFASGGNGKVFQGIDRNNVDRKVAIKKVVLDRGDEKKTENIRKEMEIMKELDHPNICKLFETYEEGRNMYFVMELCEGGELFDRIADDGNVTEAVAANIINQVSGALNYAHNMGIAHRDLKPENICLVSRNPADNAVKVIDWGLGFFFGGKARMKSAVGSLAYAAPEVLEAEESSPYTAACDLWSLGAMAYVMLCGRPPFWGSVANQLKKMHADSFPMKDSPWNTISNDAKDFIKCLLRADPRARLPISRCMDHAWLRNARDRNVIGTEAMSTVLWNMEKSSNNSKFLSVCLASAARQLDCKNFVEIKEVFQKLDVNHDGTLDMEELRNGLVQIYGMDSQQAQNVASMFEQLDLDDDGKIDYTEFCAAALSEKMLEQENILWIAFKSFDVHGDDGKITKEEIEEVLGKANVREVWTPEVCDSVATEVLQMFDKEGRGYLDFDAWLRMMRTVQGTSPPGTRSSLSLGATPSASSSLPQRPAARQMVAWVSLDPRTAQINAYPKEIASIIEANFQMKNESVDLGAKFFNARVCFSGSKTGQPFQRTPNGLRDVRRLELPPGVEEMDLPLNGTPGEYRFAAGDSTFKQRTSGTSKSAIDPLEALEHCQPLARQEQRPRTSASGWSFSDISGTFNETAGAVGKLLWGARNADSTTKKPCL